MSIWSQVRNWLASFRRVDGIELPNEGRSSVEKVAGAFGFGSAAIGSVLPEFNLDMLRTLKDLWLYNPDLSQSVSNIVNLGNTGHQITIDAANERIAETALQRVNESASRLYPNGAGVDGLINAYLAQTAWSGALSSEDVVNFAGQRVERVVLVPVEQIRFRYLEGRYVPHQQPGTLLGVGRGPLGLIPLNENTYHYYASQTIENSPYAKPPATAAVEILTGPQKDALDNIKWIVKKLGILGLVSVSVAAPSRKVNEAEHEYTSRAQKYLAAVRKVLDGNFNKGLLVTYRDQKVDHANVVSDARGAPGVMQVIEEWAFSGMGSMAAFHGRNYTTTETFADVIYNVLLAQIFNFQRLAKRRQEQTYRLDTMLAGIPIDGLALAFNRPEARDEVKKASAEQTRQTMVLEKARAGIISPDQAAQELGYDSAFDPELLVTASPEVAQELRAGRLSGANLRDRVSATCRFDRDAQRYRFVSSRIELSGPVAADPDNVVRLKKKAA